MSLKLGGRWFLAKSSLVLLELRGCSLGQYNCELTFKRERQVFNELTCIGHVLHGDASFEPVLLDFLRPIEMAVDVHR